jgi:methionyl-tRNA formyltransferase
MVQRLMFMGTPQFAVPSLKAVAEQYDVVAVVTQPDRPASRGRKPTPPPVKKAAVALGLSVLQPETLRDEEVVGELRELAPRVIVVAAYGQILRFEVLDIPPAGVINVHPSLLPKYRGASPIAGALLAGEEETGVTIMLMDEGMDTGPILAQEATEIRLGDTTGSLEDRLATLGAELLVDTLSRWLDGRIDALTQDDSEATYTRLISKDEAVIDWTLPALELWHRVRAYNPRPGARTSWAGSLLKVLRARPDDQWRGSEEPGRVLELPDGVAVATGQGVLFLDEVQLAGRRAMTVQDFARGHREFVGSLLGE